MASKLGEGRRKEADEFVGVGTPLVVALWLLFAAGNWLIMPAYARMSTESEAVVQDVIHYGRIVCVFSVGFFLESIGSKVMQGNGDMKTLMLAQIMGAVTNIVLDPLLIYGLMGLPEIGVSSAAIAAVAGQMVVAAVGAKRIPSRTQKSAVSYAHRKGLSLGRPEYPDTVRLYLLYSRPEPHSVGLLRSGGHCAGALL